MNRKQKVLTIIALVAFVAIGVCHYLGFKTYLDYTKPRQQTYEILRSGWEWTVSEESIVPDVRIPWFMLGVLYVGLFFLLTDRKERR